MNKKLALIILTSAISFAGTGLNCKEVKDMGANEIKACVAQTDDLLNANYKKLMSDSMFSKMPQNKKALKVAQNAWLKFRDASCDLELTLGQASSHKEEMLNTCMVKITIQRNNDLEALIENYIGN